jgi:hypothetical protein
VNAVTRTVPPDATIASLSVGRLPLVVKWIAALGVAQVTVTSTALVKLPPGELKDGALTVSKPLTRAGAKRIEVEPSPSWPSLFTPHAVVDAGGECGEPTRLANGEGVMML